MLLRQERKFSLFIFCPKNPKKKQEMQNYLSSGISITFFTQKSPASNGFSRIVKKKKSIPIFTSLFCPS